MPGYADNKDAIQKRLRRIEGQVRGLQRMVDEDAYCIDVLTRSRPRPRRCRRSRSSCSTTTSRTASPTRSTDGRRRGRRRRSPRRRRRSPGSCGRDASVLAFVTLADIGDSLREAFFMFWETLWALDPRLHAVGRGAGVRVEGRRCSACSATTGPASVARASGLRDGVVELLVRGDGDGEVAVPEGRRLHLRDGVHVRVDQPRARARHRAARADGLAVRRGRVRRRPDHDRAARARSAASCSRGALVAQARERLQHGIVGGHDHQAMVGVSDERQAELERTPWRRS